MLHLIKNEYPLKSPLGLNKDYWFWKSYLKNFNYKLTTKFLLKKEKELIKKFPAGYDGGTNRPNSVTSRYTFYNLFSLKNVSKEVTLIKNFIKLNVKDLLLHSNINELNDLWIICWFNVLRKGEHIDRHSHYSLTGAHESFVSGHFCVNAFNTSTFYKDIGDTNELKVKNEIGQLSLFPSYISHWSDIHEGDDVRITIAFDVYFKKEFIRNKNFLQNKIVIPFKI